MVENNKEIWKDVPGYEGYYQVSDMGRVRSVDRTVFTQNGQYRTYKGKLLRGGIASGYQTTKLSKGGVDISFQHSQLVAMAFLNHKPDRYKIVVDHINGDTSDDRLSNLRVVTHRENLSTCFRSYKKELTSQYVGVSWSKSSDKWCASIHYEGTTIFLGYYKDEIRAYKSYQLALSKIKDKTFNPVDYKAKTYSKYRGVTFCKNSRLWIAQISVNRKSKYLGRFNTELEAHQAYQKALKERHHVAAL